MTTDKSRTRILPWFVLAVLLIGVGAGAGVWWLIVIGVLLLLFSGSAALSASKRGELQGAAAGATRVEVVRQRDVEGTVNQYSRAGWSLVEQSTAKSFGSQARVTMTFRKG